MLYQGETLQLHWLDNGIAELVFNAPGSVNKLDTRTVASLGEALTVLEKQTELKGLLLRSTKAAFIVGADITEFLSLFAAPAEKLQEWLVFANSIFNRLEDLPVPTISAINGYALGGGCECILATDFRVASPDARIGLPETKLGIMPGFGGSVRLPRLLGNDSALEIIAAGKDVSAKDALKVGLVDAVVSDARYAAQVPGVDIVLQAESDVEYTVKGNAELMRRAVDNIVRNALRFSSHGQRVTVALTRVDNQLQIAVSDQGPGVEEAKLSSIFDPFVRVKSALSGKGYGLGLAITRKVVLAHGGQVEARNGDKEGLVITLRIPRWQ